MLLVVATRGSGTMALYLYADEPIRLQINDSIVNLGKDPLIIEDRLLIPARVFAEYFGAIVHWDPDEQSVTISGSGSSIIMRIGEQTVWVDDHAVQLDVAARIYDQSTYVPLRFLAEELGVRVDYYSDQNIVAVNFPVMISIGEVMRLSSGVELIISGSASFSYTTMILANPDRYVIDLQNTILEEAEGTLAVNIAGISTIRYAHHQTATPYTRVVLDMEGSTQGLNIGLSPDGRSLIIKSSFYYIRSMRNQKIGNGESLTLSLDGRIAPQMESRYLNGPAAYNGDTGSEGPEGNTGELFPDPDEEAVDNPLDEEGTEDPITGNEQVEMVREYIATTLDDLNFRAGPGVEYDSSRVLPKGTVAVLIKRQGEWAYLRLDNGLEGWCNTNYLEFGQRDVPLHREYSSSSHQGITPEKPGMVEVPNISLSGPDSSPEMMRELLAVEAGHGDTFRIYLPGVFPQIPEGFTREKDSLIKQMSLTPAEEGCWLNIDLQRSLTYQISVIDNQLEIAINLDTQLNSLSFTRDASGSIVTLQMSRLVGYEVSFRSNPERIEIAIPGAAVVSVPTQQLVRDGLISQIKTQTTQDGAIVTIELEYMIGYRVLSDQRSDKIEIRLFSKGLQGKTVFLDPGHGGNYSIDNGDTGAISRTYPVFHEATSTLDIALKLRDLLEEAGVTVMMTRSSDRAVDIRDRVRMINDSNADVLLSIHHNASTNPAANGVETFYWRETVDRQRFAEILQSNLIGSLRLTDRGVKRAAFYPINQATMPGALVEVGFLSNSIEEMLIRDDFWRLRVAYALFDALQEFFE